MRSLFVPIISSCLLVAPGSFAGTSHHPDEDTPLFPTVQTPEQPGLDSVANPVFYGLINTKSLGPIAPQARSRTAC